MACGPNAMSAKRRFKFPFYNHKLLEMNFFNWTMNYRRDSDIVESYGFEVRKRSEKISIENFTLKKLPNGQVRDSAINQN